MQKTISITDRKEAIKTAYMLAQPGDVILIAGKGHETLSVRQNVLALNVLLLSIVARKKKCLHVSKK